MSTVTPVPIGPAVTRIGATRAAVIALLAVNALMFAIAVVVMLRLGLAADAAHGPQPTPAPAPAPTAPR
jgi:hypothetical protein